MKLLSIAIPCYNSEKYMRKCIDSLLIGGEDVEILNSFLRLCVLFIRRTADMVLL